MTIYATWNPADKEASITLSGGNLIATSGASTWRNVRSTISKTSGKWYWEVTASFVGVDNIFAIGNSSMSLGPGGALYPGVDINAKVYYSNGNTIYNNTFTGYGVSYATGDVIGVALDMDGGNVTFYKNGVSQGSTAIQVTGAIFAVAGIDGNGKSQTANFGASPFTYTVPSGYNPGLTDVPIVPNNGAGFLYLMI